MKTIQKLMSSLALITFISFTSCSSDNENAEENPQQKQLSSVLDDFQQRVENLDVPTTLKESQNLYAQQANGFFNSYKIQSSSLLALSNIPSNATQSNKAGKSSSGTSKTYTWSSGANTIKYTIVESSDRYSFKYEVESPKLTETLMSGYYLKDESYAEFSMFDNNGDTTVQFKWWVKETTVKMEMNNYGSTKIILQSNRDNSGNIKVYKKTKLISEYNWISNGSGWYKNYENGKSYNW